MDNTYTFHVRGMHCASCVTLTEEGLREHPLVREAHASLKNHSVAVTGDFSKHSPQAVADLLNSCMPEGYSLALERDKHQIQWKDLIKALPFALGFVAIFVLLQKIGVVNAINSSDIGYGTAFIIGILASVSTCMAVVGGLVLSVSSQYAKEGSRVRPQMLFHVGRLVSFFVLGGAIGALGSAFQLGATGTFVLSFVVALILLMLGLNLLDIFPWMKKLQPTLPRFIGGKVAGLKGVSHTLAPLLLGTATFFLPCGFTQSMQIYTLTTGNFLQGALMMGIFALGTLPVLALLSFGSMGIRTKARSGIFFKAAGMVVLFFGIYNLLNSFAAAGIIAPVFNW